MEQLQALKLGAMAAVWTAQQQDAPTSALSFDERFGLLVEAEWAARENARLTRHLQAAKLKLGQACLEALDYAARRELDKPLLRQLATGRWVAEHQQVLITGATGTGKTFVACALAHHACRQGYRARYWRVARLFAALALARADGTYPRLSGKQLVNTGSIQQKGAGHAADRGERRPLARGWLIPSRHEGQVQFGSALPADALVKGRRGALE
jgi:DNA replication protein DnaC